MVVDLGLPTSCKAMRSILDRALSATALRPVLLIAVLLVPIVVGGACSSDTAGTPAPPVEASIKSSYAIRVYDQSSGEAHLRLMPPVDQSRRIDQSAIPIPTRRPLNAGQARRLESPKLRPLAVNVDTPAGAFSPDQYELLFAAAEQCGVGTDSANPYIANEPDTRTAAATRHQDR